MCTGCVLHVWADFPHRSWTWNNGLHIGCAQPGSAEMLSFLRLCHAVWSRKDMWFYFFCRKSDTENELLASQIFSFSILHICAASMYFIFFVFACRKCNNSTHYFSAPEWYISILVMFSRWSGLMFIFFPRLCVRPRTGVNLLWLKRGMAWLSRFLLLLVVLSAASLFNYIDLSARLLFYSTQKLYITLWFMVQLYVNKVVSAQFLFFFNFWKYFRRSSMAEALCLF